MLCLKGFAIFVGGATYLRSCERALLALEAGRCPSRISSVPSPCATSQEDNDMQLSIREASMPAVAFQATEFISTLLNSLVENDPASSRRVISTITVGGAFQRYIDSSEDQMSVVSETKFRNIWKCEVAKGGYKIKDQRTTKCDICLKYSADLKKVRATN